MLKRLAFTFMIALCLTGLASARDVNSLRVTSGDTTTYYLDGKVVSAESFTNLGDQRLVSIEVDKTAGTVRGFTNGAAATEPRSYESKGTRIDWSEAKALEDVSYVVDDQVTDARTARLLAAEQIESVYRLPASANDSDDVGSFGKNGVIIIRTRKN